MKKKTLSVLLAAIVAAVFGAVGYPAIAGLWVQVEGAIVTRSWIAVPAQVLDTQLQVSEQDATTYRVTARYRYVHGGRSYEATRVGLWNGSDNFDDWSKEHYRRLRDARAAGEPVTAWVDPQSPSRAVLDREIRWRAIAFMIPFALLFPLVALGAVVALVMTLVRPDEIEAAAAPGDAQEIRSSARHRTIVAWLFGMLFALVAVPLGTIIATKPGIGAMGLAGGLLAAIGIILLVRAARLTWRYARLGETWLSIDPPAPVLGRLFHLRARFERPPRPGEYRLALVCERVDGRGDSTRRSIVWRDERTGMPTGTSLAASFAPPADLPAAEPADAGVSHRWLVRLDYPEGHGEEREFEVTLRAASSLADPDATTSHAPLAARRIPVDVARVRHGMERLEVNFAPLPWTYAAVTTLVAAGLFALAYGLRSDWTAAAWFGVTGVIVLLMAAFSARHRVSVRFAGGRLVVSRRGILRTERLDVPMAEVVELVSVLRENAYEILARNRDGASIEISDSIESSGVAQALVELYRSQLGEGVATSHIEDNREFAAASAPASRKRPFGRNWKWIMYFLAGLFLLRVVYSLFA